MFLKNYLTINCGKTKWRVDWITAYMANVIIDYRGSHSDISQLTNFSDKFREKNSKCYFSRKVATYSSIPPYKHHPFDCTHNSARRHMSARTVGVAIRPCMVKLTPAICGIGGSALAGSSLIS